MNQIETIGVDLGGTKMAVGVVGERPETLWDSKVPVSYTHLTLPTIYSV